MANFLLMVLATVLFTGCLGGLDQDDMRRHAIRRARDKKPETTAQRKPGADARSSPTKSTHMPPKPAQPPPTKPAAATSPVPPSAAEGAAQTNEATKSGPALGLLQRAPIPAEPLNLVERRKRTIDNLTKIGASIAQYVHDNHRLFPQAIRDTRGNPVLSWRVALLPYLGYQDLYRQFRLYEPWDSAHNQQLAAYIPAEYQSPERFDTRTNYLVPEGAATPFHGKFGIPRIRVEDGLANTVAVVESDEDSAVSWTRPKDLKYSLRTVRDHLGHLRQDGFFATWCDGTVSRVTKDANGRDLKAIFTYESGDAFSRAPVRADATPAVAVNDATAAVQSEPKGSDGGGASTSSTAASSRTVKPDRTTERGATTVAPRDRQLPVPDLEHLAAARALAAEIYREKYNQARTAPQRQALARKLLGEAAKSVDDPPSQYVLLEIAIKIATEAGDRPTALAAVDQIVTRFDVDPFDVKYEVLTKFARRKRRSGSASVLETARQLLRLALDRDAFDKAEELCHIALAEANRLSDVETVRVLHDTKDRISDARTAYSKLRRTLDAVQNVNDPRVNLEAGKYYCLIKGDWQRGLPLLAKSGDARLEEIARQEALQPAVAHDQVQLANRWWALAEDSHSGGQGARQRAAYWYAQALKTLPHGLLRIKAEMRVQQVTTAR